MNEPKPIIALFVGAPRLTGKNELMLARLNEQFEDVGIIINYDIEPKISGHEFVVIGTDWSELERKVYADRTPPKNKPWYRNFDKRKF